MDLVPRVGTFFLLMGAGSLVLFILAALGSEVNVLFLLLAVLGLSLGFAFRRKKEPNPPGTRFASLRRMNEQNRKRREERLKNRKR